jgi:Hint domain-containing protein
VNLFRSHCFPAGTRVKTPRGTCLIEAIRVGDELTVVDFLRSLTSVGSVTRVDKDVEPVLLSIHFDSGDLLVATPSQRIYHDGEWILVGSIQPESRLGKIFVSKVIPMAWNRDVFTLVVQPSNNYVVVSAGGYEFICHDNSSDIGYPAGFEERFSALAVQEKAS